MKTSIFGEVYWAVGDWEEIENLIPTLLYLI